MGRLPSSNDDKKSKGQVSEASSATGAAASRVLTAATELSNQAETLRSELGRFLDEVRAA
jgi:methyl-accepting chemotaxis protein